MIKYNKLPNSGDLVPRRLISLFDRRRRKHIVAQHENENRIQLTMQKLSAIVKNMAMTALKSSNSVPSSEAAHAALLFVQVAWNKSLGNNDAYRNYQGVLDTLEESNPALWNEFITSDHGAILADLARYKEEHYPHDPRVIVMCGMREGNVHVEWTDE